VCLGPWNRAAILGPLAMLLACSSGLTGTGPSRTVAEGAWGGPDVSLVVDTKGAAADFNCSHGRIEEPLVLQKDGSFRAQGYWVREGGPQQEIEDRRPATYSGTSDGHKLALRVKVTDPPRDLGPFTLVLGEPAVLHKCD
jgi:hypothetical protein